MSKIFLDTNVLAYPWDEKAGWKADSARAVVKDIWNQEGVISTQVLQELYVTMTRKFSVEVKVAKEYLARLNHFEIVTMSPVLIQEAIECQVSAKLSFWDALIVTAAASARCETILSEDLNGGQRIQGIRVENPFRAC